GGAGTSGAHSRSGDEARRARIAARPTWRAASRARDPACRGAQGGRGESGTAAERGSEAVGCFQGPFLRRAAKKQSILHCARQGDAGKVPRGRARRAGGAAEGSRRAGETDSRVTGEGRRQAWRNRKGARWRVRRAERTGEGSGRNAIADAAQRDCTTRES